MTGSPNSNARNEDRNPIVMTDRPEAQQQTSPPASEPDKPQDPVTGTTDNATGEEQAAENEDRDPVG
jgi:hypothetical protein